MPVWRPGVSARSARLAVWIGEIQWMRRNGFEVDRKPILKPLHNVENRDAILNPDRTGTTWPDADVIIGNPPFLCAKLMKPRLEVATTGTTRAGV
jgi:hypothetical protein